MKGKVSFTIMAWIDVRLEKRAKVSTQRGKEGPMPLSRPVPTVPGVARCRCCTGRTDRACFATMGRAIENESDDEISWIR
jgi:hypothetical protein